LCRVSLAGNDTSSGLIYNNTTLKYYCNNAGTSGIVAEDTYGDGCPATLAPVKPHGVAVDSFGNVFFTSTLTAPEVRVIYAGGSQVASLITLENPTVTNPQVGYIYKIAGGVNAGYSGDGGLATKAEFVNPYGIAVDGSGNVYFTDSALQTTSGSNTVELAANNVRKINAATGIITTVAGENTCTYSTTVGCPYSPSAVDGSAAAGGLLNTPWYIFLDTSGNLYIVEYYTAKIRVVYQAGTIAGISSPQVGDIYTFAGGGTLTANGTSAKQVLFGQLSSGGIDAAGNIYVGDIKNSLLWQFNAATGIGYIVAGGKTSTTVAAKGAYCNAGSSGPVSTDSIGDGCPAVQAELTGTEGIVSFDSAGNFYVAEQNSGGVVLKFSYNNQFPATAVGSASTQPLAFESLTAASLTGKAITLQGAATAEFSDSGTGDTCSTSSVLAVGGICVFNIAFTPAYAGPRAGGIQLGLSTSAGTSVQQLLSGTGLASDIAVDAGTTSQLGTAIIPNGVAADLLGNLYVSDSAANRVLKGSSTGTTLASLVTGLNAPSQIAVDGFGNLYVADTGNNRVLETTAAGVTLNTVGSGLAGPKGVAVNASGDIYIGDTGNNRVVEVFPNGTQQTLPLTGISGPTQLALDSAGDLFVLNAGANSVLELSKGVQSKATLDAGVVPAGIALDPAGDLYVADSTGLRVLAYPPGATFGTLLLSGLKTPVALAADPFANLFIADTANTGAVELRRSIANIAFPLTNVGQTTTESIAVSNVGNATLTFPTAPLIVTTGSSLFSVVPATANGCAIGSTYAAGAGCGFNASFTPTATGSSTAKVTFNTNAANGASVSALLTAQALQLVTTSLSIAVVSPVPTISYSQTVTLQLTLTPSTTTTAPTGTFSVGLDGKSLSSQSVSNTTLTLANLSVGTHLVAVSYSGDGVYASSAATQTLIVNLANTSTVLTVPAVSANGLSISGFSATVGSATATCNTGTVSFYSGTTVLATSSLGTNGTATFYPTSFIFPASTFTAVYNGSANCAMSTSAVNTPPGDFYVTPSSANSSSVSQGGILLLSYTVTPLYTAPGTVTPSCTGLPSNSVCRFQPQTIPLETAAQTETIQLVTNISSTLAWNPPGPHKAVELAFGLPLGLNLGLLLRRRKKWAAAAIFIIGFVLSSTLLGCGPGISAATASQGLVTPSGVYNVNVVFTGSNGVSTTHTVPLTLNVLQDSGPF
jgi:sugar lactone lactonase YvrE